MKIVRFNARYMLNALYKFGGQRSPFSFRNDSKGYEKGYDHYDENRWGIGMKIVTVNARYMLNALYKFGGQRSPFSFRND